MPNHSEHQASNRSLVLMLWALWMGYQERNRQRYGCGVWTEFDRCRKWWAKVWGFINKLHADEYDEEDLHTRWVQRRRWGMWARSCWRYWQQYCLPLSTWRWVSEIQHLRDWHLPLERTLLERRRHLTQMRSSVERLCSARLIPSYKRSGTSTERLFRRGPLSNLVSNRVI